MALTETRWRTPKEQEKARGRANRLRAITETIENHYGKKLPLSDIAAEQGVSMNHLSHFFRECFGISYQEYLRRLRCERAEQMLLKTDLTLMDISERCGFSDSKYFRRAFQAQYGLTPKAYRERAAQREPARDFGRTAQTQQAFLNKADSLTALRRYGLIDD